MDYFDCQSHLNITLQVVFDILTAQISLKHMDNHTPYCAMAVSPLDLEWIPSNQTQSMKDVHGQSQNEHTY